jgi:polysaccharide biosynthesis transport protein
MATIEQGRKTEEISFDIADLFAFLWQQKFRLIFTSAIIVVAAGYYISTLPKIYSATSTLLLGSGESSFAMPGALSSFSGGGRSKMDTYLEFIRTRQFLGNIVDNLSLTYDPEFRPKNKQINHEEARNYAIGEILKNLTLSKVGDTDLLKVTYNSKNPKTAMDVANQLGPAFFEYHAQMNKQKADDASVWLNSQLAELQNKLSASETALQKYIEDNQIIAANSQIELVKGEISALLTEKLVSEKTLAEAKSTLNQIQLANGDAKTLMRVPWIMNNPMVESLRNTILAKEQAFTELSKRYQYKHHKYIAAQAALNDLNAERNALLERLTAGLKQNIATLERRLLSLQTQSDTAKKQYSELGRHEMQLTRLRRELEATQKLYEVFVSRLQETEVLKDLDKNKEFAIVDSATLPIYPSQPRVVMLTAVACLMAIIFSVGFWLILHLISDRQTRLRQLLRKLDLAVLAEIPKLKTNAKTVAKVVDSGHKDYGFAEAIRTLRTAVLVRADERENRTIALTSVRNGDGKTTIGICLAQSFAKLEKTILVDSDLRQPSIAEAFGLDKAQPGLSSFISGKMPFSQCLYRQPDTQLNVLPSGAIQADPMIYLSKPRFAQLLKKLGVVYERVVVEVPSVSVVSDALVISKFVDGVILICDAEQTQNDSLIEAVHRLREAGAPLLGVVFNKVKRIRHHNIATSKSRPN